jgi:UDP-N-acetylmuramoylalanine--D-glutamate ligase
MGLGIHGGGLGVARFLAAQGADVTVTDMRGPEVLRASLDALAGLPIRFVIGEHREEDFRAAEIVVRNPAVPATSPFLQIARAAGAQIEMEMTLFFRLCPGPILGVTGTKGKTTTTMLLGAMLREQFPETVVAGNLRVSALEQLPQITASTPVVLELSSFVLEGLGDASLSPQYALVTNLSPDHLDRYGTMEAYAAAKRQIVAHQQPGDVAVLNHEDALVREFAANAGGKVVWFGSALPPFLADEDVQLPGAHNRANIAAAAAVALSFGIGEAQIRAAVRGFTGVEHRLEFVRELHGVRYINDTAATAPEAAIAALASFERPIVLIAGGADKNLPFESFARAIAERAKALVLVDGTATGRILGALNVWALSVERLGVEDVERLGVEDVEDVERLGVEDVERLGVERLGVGGVEKTASTSNPQRSTLNEGVEKTASTSNPQRSTLKAVTGPYNDFQAAVRAAQALATPGDVVLLSPGCASFGMFRNEFHRGEEFRRIVSLLE